MYQMLQRFNNLCRVRVTTFTICCWQAILGIQAKELVIDVHPRRLHTPDKDMDNSASDPSFTGTGTGTGAGNEVTHSIKVRLHWKQTAESRVYMQQRLASLRNIRLLEC